jgi:hypothetical protein
MIRDFLRNELHLSGIYLAVGVLFAIAVLVVLLSPSKDTWLDRASRLSHTWQWIIGLSLGLVVIAVFAVLGWLSVAP